MQVLKKKNNNKPFLKNKRFIHEALFINHKSRKKFLKHYFKHQSQ